MDFAALFQKLLGAGGQGAAGAPMDIRPPAAGGQPLPAAPPPAAPAPAAPSIFNRLGAGIQNVAANMGGDSPMGAAGAGFAASRAAKAGPSILPAGLMPKPAPAMGAGPMDIRPPIAGGPASPPPSDMAGGIQAIAHLLGSI